MVDFKAFKSILKKDQKGLKNKIKHYLENIGYKTVAGDGFIYAKGSIPILLVAHLDTVHKQKPSQIYYDSEQGVMWSPQGIGGDDRCGVYIILKLLSKYKPHVLFTEDEEIGCVGAKKTTETLKKPNVKFIIEIDRRGSDDCVFYDCDNKDFQKYIQDFGFTLAHGTYSDIVELSEEWDIASVNLSAGYYQEHTTSETIKTNDMIKTFERVAKILEDDSNNKTFFKYERMKYSTPSYQQTFTKDDYYHDQYGYVDENGYWHWYDEEDYEYLDSEE